MALPPFGADFFDAPFVSQIAFVPRKTARTGRNDDRVREGSLDVGTAELGWCCYGRGGEAVAAAAPVVAYFHANAETAADVEHLAPVLFAAGAAAVLAFDYRGYGWSTGSPTFSTLLSDMDAVASALPALLATLQLADRPRVAYGRSLGAACAAHVVSLTPEAFAGLVLDSGLLDVRSLPMVANMAAMLGGGADMLSALPDPLGTEAKLARVTCPLLVLHSEADEIVPFTQGQRALRAAALSRDKLLHAFQQSGHNDIVARHREVYTRVLSAFLQKASGVEAAPAEDEAALRALPVRELRLRLAARGIDAKNCIEKSDFVALLLQK